jgi:peptidyl-prolyl cis-trans isomerase A (cyclophilin A)
MTTACSTSGATSDRSGELVEKCDASSTSLTCTTAPSILRVQMKNKQGKRRTRTEAETETETEPTSARDAATARPAPAKPSPGQGKPPWTAYAIVGGLVALIAWGLWPTGGATGPGADDAGAAGASSALAADGGLGVEDLVVGRGAEATRGDKVKVHYVGTLTTGTEFDSSRKHGEPFDFQLGAGEVIKGWDQGVAGMKVGGKRRLTVPASLGYGSRGAPPVIPANATLVFEIELLEVTKGSAPAARAERGAPPPSADDPLKGNFSLADATKNLKGTGALTAKIETSLGTVSCRLYDDKAPVTVANFIGLATGERTWKNPSTGTWGNKPAYDGTTFHRVIKGFMIQGGDPKGNGSGEPGYVIKDEIWEGAKHDRTGLLCMANRGHDTNGAQFFITEEPKASLDGNYTIFGECAPTQLIHDIAKVPTGPSDRPETPVIIKSVKIARVAKP